MKNSLFSIFTLLFTFASLQTANAQTKPNEAKLLYDAVMESKAEIADLVKKGGVMLEARKEVVMHDAKDGNQDGIIMPDSKTGDSQDAVLHELVNELNAMQDFCNRVEKTGGKMTAAQLAAFKAEAANFDSKLDQIKAQTPSAYGDCIGDCIRRYPNWWQAVLRAGCFVKCLFIN